MATFVKLPSGTIINVELIRTVGWDKSPAAGRYLYVAMANTMDLMLRDDNPDSHALWRYLCGHSDEAR